MFLKPFTCQMFENWIMNDFEFYGCNISNNTILINHVNEVLFCCLLIYIINIIRCCLLCFLFIYFNIYFVAVSNKIYQHFFFNDVMLLSVYKNKTLFFNINIFNVFRFFCFHKYFRNFHLKC